MALDGDAAVKGFGLFSAQTGAWRSSVELTMFIQSHLFPTTFQPASGHFCENCIWSGGYSNVGYLSPESFGLDQELI